ncbi:alpha/beta fold hydrolase [Nonomuraea thailandensis]
MRIDEVDGLRIATFGTGPRTIIAVHGITASLMAWAAVGRRLPDGWSLVAMDLRGRGHSASLPGPYGLPRHAEDVLRVADHVGAGPDAVLTGHSMGAYVAALAGARREFAGVVLVDGGIPLPPIPEGMDPGAALEATLGPALARLRQTFPSAEAYVDFFKAHPAFAGRWNADVEAYVRYDLTGPEGRCGRGWRARRCWRTGGGCSWNGRPSRRPCRRSPRRCASSGLRAGCSTSRRGCCPTTWRGRGRTGCPGCGTRWCPAATTTRSCSTSAAWPRWWTASPRHADTPATVTDLRTSLSRHGPEPTRA